MHTTIRLLAVMTVAMMTIGCNHAGVEARSTVATAAGSTQIHIKGETTHPEAAMHAAGVLIQRTTAAQNEAVLVQEKRMPFYSGGCYGNQCWRHYGRHGAGPLPTGRFTAPPPASAPTAKASPERDAELEAARKEAAEAKLAKEKALDALQSAVQAAEQAPTSETATEPPAPE